MAKRTTLAEREHMALIAQMPCCICNQWPVHVHHLPGQGLKPSGFFTIPLCPFHHMDGGYGEAVHQGRRKWESNFGTTEKELHKKVTAQLAFKVWD